MSAPASEFNHYMKFLGELNNGVLDKTKQYDLGGALEDLLSKEYSFKKTLIKYKKGLQVYEKFISYITEDERNILAARIFFREREATFSKHISKAIKNKDVATLLKFKINYKFMNWAVNNCNIPQRKKLEGMLNSASEYRRSIIEQNLPLVVNRSRLYQYKTRKYSIDALEFIQVAVEGFMAAIDKFVPMKDVQFKGVAVGWMQARLMADFSDGFLKLSVREKRILYRANVAIYRHSIKEINDVLKFVRISFPKTTMKALEDVLSSSIAPSNIELHSSSDNGILDANEQRDNESEIVRSLDQQHLIKEVDLLPCLQKKVIILRGGL